MVAYMTTTVSGRELGKILTDGPEAKLFTVPTGRIYTVAMLLARLQQSHAAATKAAAGSKNFALRCPFSAGIGKVSPRPLGEGRGVRA